jgi:hypothetical protein
MLLRLPARSTAPTALEVPSSVLYSIYPLLETFSSQKIELQVMPFVCSALISDGTIPGRGEQHRLFW